MAGYLPPMPNPSQPTDYSGFLFNSLDKLGQGFVDRRKAKQDYALQLEHDKYAQGQDSQMWDWRQQQAAQDQSNADRSYALDLERVQAGSQPPVPTGYQKTDTGYGPIPGGPADPATIEAQSKARGTATRLRTLPQTTVTALGEAGSSVADVGRVNSEFKPEFAGYYNQTIGDAANYAARTGIGMGLVGNEEAAKWWQDYQTQKNVRRHALFGSALTKSELPQFEAADINPGMTPKAIQDNLARQDMIAKRAAKKLALFYIKAGYPPDQIEAAIGVPLSELGIQAQDAATDPGQIQAALDRANDLIAQGADPAEVKAKLLEMGIDLDAIQAGQQ